MLHLYNKAACCAMRKLKILYKDIGNFKKKKYCKQKYAEKLQILCKNIEKLEIEECKNTI